MRLPTAPCNGPHSAPAIRVLGRRRLADHECVDVKGPGSFDPGCFRARRSARGRGRVHIHRRGSATVRAMTPRTGSLPRASSGHAWPRIRRRGWCRHRRKRRPDQRVRRHRAPAQNAGSRDRANSNEGGRYITTRPGSDNAGSATFVSSPIGTSKRAAPLLSGLGYSIGIVLSLAA